MGNLITDSEAAEILCLTPRQVAKYAKKGILPSVKLPGDEIRFDPDDLRQWCPFGKLHLQSCRLICQDWAIATCIQEKS
ncbi:MAG: helix-turn-helix domain-containing protein, partial [Pirellulales bacterium]|nr:helix-turn-helix domain-containing protein [Pirellulales bacterium]